MRVGVYEAVGETCANGRRGKKVRQRRDKQVREFAKGARGPGVNLQMGWQHTRGGGGEFVKSEIRGEMLERGLWLKNWVSVRAVEGGKGILRTGERLRCGRRA